MGVNSLQVGVTKLIKKTRRGMVMRGEILGIRIISKKFIDMS